jgi:hypothetical protein
MTDARIKPVAKTDQRTIRIPDDQWEAGLAAAKANGENISAVVRRKIAEYVQTTTEGYRTEYRATSLAEPGRTVTGITGDLKDILLQYPPTHWQLETCQRSPYFPVGDLPEGRPRTT